jgi:hypothetical protein
MMKDGIDVWFDEWEIRTGDSLRRKMDDGLSNCTHFLVLLTPESIGKPWVETEIDAGFLRNVGGESHFMGIRSGVELTKLSPFLRTLRCPEVGLNDDSQVKALIAEIHGVSKKPALGSAPNYVTSSPLGLARWSKSAIAVARYLVETSKYGTAPLDPQTDPDKVSAAIGLPVDDVKMGALDLRDAKLVEESAELNSERFWPKVGLFIEFDRYFLAGENGASGFDSKAAAVAVSQLLINDGARNKQTEELAKRFPQWTPRQFNSAINYLVESNIVDSFRGLGTSECSASQVTATIRTKRFVANNV